MSNDNLLLEEEENEWGGIRLDTTLEKIPQDSLRFRKSLIPLESHSFGGSFVWILL